MTVRMPDYPSVDRESLKRSVLGMVGRHTIDHGEDQPLYVGAMDSRGRGAWDIYSGRLALGPDLDG